MGRPEVVTFGVNYDGAFDNNAIKFMARLAEIKYPTNPNNRSYRVSRQRWIVHYARQIQLAVANGAAPAISLAIRNIKSQLVTSSMESCGNLDKGIPAFRKEGNQYREIHEDKVAYASLNARGKIQLEATPPFNDGAVLSETHDREHISRNDSIRHTSVQSKTNTKTDKRIENSHDVVLQLPHLIDDIDDSDNSQLPSSPEMYHSLSFNETQDVVSFVGREIQLKKDYTTGNATFKQGSRGTVIEAPSRKDGKLKVKLDNDNEKTFRLIKECDLQLYEGVDFSPNSKFTAGAASSETHDRDHISRNDSIRHTSVQSKTNTKTDKRMENSNDVILQLSPSIDDIEDSENSQLQSSPEMYSLSIKETQDVMSIVGREIQLTKDYTTGNATFKQGSRGTVIEVPSRKDGKLKVKLDNDNEKTFRLIKECDLQLYEGGPLSFSSESQTAETSFEY